jgi:serine/threonine-protein kinase
LEGLHAAHDAVGEHGEPLGIVHRDVSPQNVIVGNDGIARVLDFGVAKASNRLQTTQDGQIKGKIEYMAPEQVRGSLVDRRTDVYAASVILWELLTGQQLYKADNPVALWGKVLEGKPSRPGELEPNVPAELDALTMRGLQLDPTTRFQTAEAMAIALEQAIHLATPREVGRWVQTLAGKTLREREDIMAELDSVASGIALSPSDLVSDVSVRRAERLSSNAPSKTSDAPSEPSVPGPPRPLCALGQDVEPPPSNAGDDRELTNRPPSRKGRPVGVPRPAPGTAPHARGALPPTPPKPALEPPKKAIQADERVALPEAPAPPTRSCAAPAMIVPAPPAMIVPAPPPSVPTPDNELGAFVPEPLPAEASPAEPTIATASVPDAQLLPERGVDVSAALLEQVLAPSGVDASVMAPGDPVLAAFAEEAQPTRASRWSLVIAGAAMVGFALGAVLLLSMGGEKDSGAVPSAPRSAVVATASAPPPEPVASASSIAPAPPESKITLVVVVSPKTATVEVGDAMVSGSSIMLERSSTPVRVTAKAAGYKPESRSFTPNQDGRMVLELERAVPSSPGASTGKVQIKGPVETEL